ncbi:hypothetical protein [Pseudomonas synxantha]|uniref:hypothetical protein n=1 Tax=Pseudomonas synxantha TaxID=47883 RepID=UPI000F564B0C|nr:hypothetical protein [Pseudomonas synxantha]
MNKSPQAYRKETAFVNARLLSCEITRAGNFKKNYAYLDERFTPEWPSETAVRDAWHSIGALVVRGKDVYFGCSVGSWPWRTYNHHLMANGKNQARDGKSAEGVKMMNATTVLSHGLPNDD